MESPKHLLTESQAAEMLGCSPNTLRDWRQKKAGPRYLKVGKRMVRYALDELEQYTQENESGVALGVGETPNDIPSDMPVLTFPSDQVAEPLRRIFMADRTDVRYLGMRPPFDGLFSLLDQGRLEDAFTYWVQENSPLEPYLEDDLHLFKSYFPVNGNVALFAAENCVAWKDLSPELADLILKLQREGRITIGANLRGENIPLFASPLEAEGKVYRFRVAKAVRAYKWLRWLPTGIWLGPNAWPPRRKGVVSSD